MNWQYFVLGILSWQIIKMLAQAINREVIEHRQRKFLKLVSIAFTDPNKTITFIATDSSDRRSLVQVEAELRKRFDIPEGESFVMRSFGDGFKN